MYGAIIGDFAGSIYEYEQTKRIKINEMIEENAFYSDDTKFVLKQFSDSLKEV